MERLIIKVTDDANFVPDNDAWIVSDEFGEKCLVGDVVDKLCQYEDTGLTPEEVMQLIKECEDKERYGLELYNRAKKAESEINVLSKAKQEGRLIELPCKVGTDVWVIDYYHDGLTGLKFLASNGNQFVLTTTYCHCEHDYESQIEEMVEEGEEDGVSLYLYNKEDVFLTREEAEKALEGLE